MRWKSAASFLTSSQVAMLLSRSNNAHHRFYFRGAFSFILVALKSTHLSLPPLTCSCHLRMNPHLKDLDDDFLYHLGYSKSDGLDVLFGDVKVNM